MWLEADENLNTLIDYDNVLQGDDHRSIHRQHHSDHVLRKVAVGIRSQHSRPVPTGLAILACLDDFGLVMLLSIGSIALIRLLRGPKKHKSAPAKTREEMSIERAHAMAE